MPSEKLKVYLYKNDYNMICTEVYRHQQMKTGGNLFGLWTTSGDVVIHAVLGPGKNCRRTETSFHQDIKYLERAGHFLNKNFMLCHVGEWHSHHQLALTEPSSGDKSTVWNNYPEGMKKFLVIIGNLVIHRRNDVKVQLSPYFFIYDGHKCIPAELEVLCKDGPFTKNPKISDEVRRGSEIEACESSARLESRTQREGLPRNDRNRVEDIANGNYLEPRSKILMQNNDNLLSISIPRTSSTKNEFPSPRTSSNQSVSFTEAGAMRTTMSAQVQPQSIQSASNTSSSLVQTQREKIINKVNDFIASQFKNVHAVNANKDEVMFHHNSRLWFISFPKTFPKEPAKLFMAHDRNRQKVQVSPPSPMDPNSLNNHLNVIFAITRSAAERDCQQCKTFSLKTLVKSEAIPIDHFLTEKGVSLVKSLYKKIPENHLADSESLKKPEITVDEKNARSVEEPVVMITFKHCLKTWIIRLTSDFPDRPAKAAYIDDESRSKRESSFQLPLQRKLDGASQITLAITQKCCCVICNRIEV